MTEPDEAMRVWKAGVVAFDAAVIKTLHLPEDEAEKVCDEAAAAVIRPHLAAAASGDVVEAIDEACSLIQEAKGLADGPKGGSVTDHLDFAESWLDKARAAIAALTASQADRARIAALTASLQATAEAAATHLKTANERQDRIAALTAENAKLREALGKAERHIITMLSAIAGGDAEAGSRFADNDPVVAEIRKALEGQP